MARLPKPMSSLARQSLDVLVKTVQLRFRGSVTQRAANKHAMVREREP